MVFEQFFTALTHVLGKKSHGFNLTASDVNTAAFYPVDYGAGASNKSAVRSLQRKAAVNQFCKESRHGRFRTGKPNGSTNAF
ncbi:hypothetical protein SAMN05192553_10657 [Cyclobacterium xiamenense]|uniref:Uncharacterized protein n=1 Tax=Cyclobacterium xiamenense TaxID=1297121 RepID=A0A1H7AG74_9BACT|nr:hypothetical protein SAMN05192553_10657 [Cyclobacterium xiamenense]